MSSKTLTEVEGTDLEPRDARALTEYMTVLGNTGRVRDGGDLYLVVSESGSEYLVDVRTGTCECPDHQYRNPTGGCKHVRRVAFATGERAIPTWVDPDAIDPDLGAQVTGESQRAVADGGQVVGADPEADDTDGECEGPALDTDAHFVVHGAICDLLAPRLDHLLADFDAWTVTVAAAANSTVAACEDRL